MPGYTFVRKSTGERWEDRMTISEMREKLEADPDLDVVPTTPTPYADSWRLGITKPSDGFRDVLRTIQKNNPRGNINIP